MGGNANNGTNDGFAYVNSDNTPSVANANIGSRQGSSTAHNKEVYNLCRYLNHVGVFRVRLFPPQNISDLCNLASWQKIYMRAVLCE